MIDQSDTPDPRLSALAVACKRITERLPLEGFSFTRNGYGMRLQLQAATDTALKRLAATFGFEIKQVTVSTYEWQQARCDFAGLQIVIDGLMHKRSEPLPAKGLEAAIDRLAEAAPETIPDP